MSNWFSTSDVAQMLECAEGTIRAKKSQKSDQFREGIHFVKDGKSTMWLQPGVELLRACIQTEAAPMQPIQAIAPSDNLVPLKPAATQSPTLDREIKAALQQPAKESALRVLEAVLPELTIEALRNLARSTDPEDRRRLEEIYRSAATVVAWRLFGVALNETLAENKRLMGGGYANLRAS